MCSKEHCMIGTLSHPVWETSSSRWISFLAASNLLYSIPDHQGDVSYILRLAGRIKCKVAMSERLKDYRFSISALSDHLDAKKSWQPMGVSLVQDFWWWRLSVYAGGFESVETWWLPSTDYKIVLYSELDLERNSDAFPGFFQAPRWHFLNLPIIIYSSPVQTYYSTLNLLILLRMLPDMPTPTTIIRNRQLFKICLMISCRRREGRVINKFYALLFS